MREREAQRVQEPANLGLPPKKDTPHPPQSPHLDSAVPGETEVVVAVLGLPGIGAAGVADDDRLGEAGVEVKRQVRGAAAEVDGEAVGKQEGGQPRTGTWKSREPTRGCGTHSSPPGLVIQSGFIALTLQHRRRSCPSPSGCPRPSYPG